MVYDLVIVGAGPASCACAIHALDAGLSVLIIERETFPRHRPGETLHPGIEPLLNQLGLDSDGLLQQSRRFSDITRVDVHGQPSRFSYDEQGHDWQGFQIPRKRLDQALLNQVEHCGGHVWVDTRLLSVQPGTETWRLSTSKGGFAGRYLIDGSGAQCATRSAAGCHTAFHSPKLYLIYGYVTGFDAEQEVVFQERDNGWYYRARIDADVTHWCVLTTTPTSSTYVPPELVGYQAADVTRRQNATWQTNQPFSGPRHYLIGDAAYRLDPSSSHGVLKAVMSGIFAAHLISNTVEGKVDEDGAKAIYHAFIMNLFKQETARLRATGWFRSVSEGKQMRRVETTS